MKLLQLISDRLRRTLFLISILTLVSGCASSRIGSPNQMAAYTAALANKPEEARSLLKLEPDNPFNKFLLSSIELSEGNFTLARQYANEFLYSTPNSPEGKVLFELIEQRKSYPSEPWTVSFASAWKASGSPEMKVIYRFLNTVDQMEIESFTERCDSLKIPEAIIGTPEELFLMDDRWWYGFGCNREKMIELSLTYASPEAPLDIKLLALDILDFRWKEEDSEGTKVRTDILKRAQVRRRELIKELSTELPAEMTFAVLAILDQTSQKEAFSLADIEQLEEAVSRPSPFPLPELYNGCLKRFITIGPPNPYFHASDTVSFIGSPLFSGDLEKKILLTAESAVPEIRSRLAAILEKVGRAQLRRKTMVGLLTGTVTLQSSAYLRNDQISEEVIRSVKMYAREQAKELENSNLFDGFTSSLAWPIRPLVIDSNELRLRDEIGFHHLFSSLEFPAGFLDFLKD